MVITRHSRRQPSSHRHPNRHSSRPSHPPQVLFNNGPPTANASRDRPSRPTSRRSQLTRRGRRRRYRTRRRHSRKSCNRSPSPNKEPLPYLRTVARIAPSHDDVQAIPRRTCLRQTSFLQRTSQPLSTTSTPRNNKEPKYH